MQILKAFFRFYISSSIHVALSVVSLLSLTYLKFEVSPDFNLYIFVFLACITGYNFVKYAPVARLHHRSLTQQLRIIQLFSLLCFLGLVVNSLFVGIEVIYFSTVLGLLNLLYAVPVYKRNLREVPLLKVFLIATIWSSVTVVFPFLEENRTEAFDVYWSFELVERFFIVVLLMVPFEVRDYPYDKAYLKTIVSSLGLIRTKILSMIVIIGLLLIRWLIFEPDEILFYVLLYLSLSYVIIISRLNQKAYFSSFWVEGLPVFWLILAFIFFSDIFY